MNPELLHARVLDNDIQYLIRARARELKRKGFRDCDLDDLTQDLTLRLLQRLETFDPEKASFYCFVIVVLDYAGRSMIAARVASCRDNSTTLSLQNPHPRKDDPTPLARVIDSSDLANRVGRYTLREDELRELVLDVQSILERMPADIRQLAGELATATRWELQCRSGHSYHLRERLERLTKALRRAGLGKEKKTRRKMP